MNNKGEFERIIEQKLDSFEYEYNDASWKKFKKQIPGKSSFLGIAAAFSIIAVSVIGLYWFFNTDSNTQKCNIFNTIANTFVPKTSDADVVNNATINIADVNNVSNSVNLTTTDHASQVVNNNVVTASADIQQSNTNNLKTSENSTLNNSNNVAKPNATFSCRNTEGCAPLSTKFVPVEITDSTIYSWDFGDGTFSTEKTPSHTYLKQGNYSVLLMVKFFKSESVISNLKQYIIKVYETPSANFTSEIKNAIVNFTNTSVGAQSYKWILNDSELYEENVEKDFVTNGKYNVKLIVTNSLGCSDTLKKNINIKISHPIYVANAFYPFTEGQNSTIGPQVENTEEYYFVFEIYNKTGQTVFLAKGNDVNWNGINKITGQRAEVGVYFYKLKATDKHGNVDELNGKINILR